MRVVGLRRPSEFVFDLGSDGAERSAHSSGVLPEHGRGRYHTHVHGYPFPEARHHMNVDVEL